MTLGLAATLARQTFFWMSSEAAYMFLACAVPVIVVLAWLWWLLTRALARVKERLGSENA